MKPLGYGKKFLCVDQFREIQIVLPDLVSFLLLSAQCILPRKESLALRPSGVKMGLELFICAAETVADRVCILAVCPAVSHNYVLYVC